MSPSRSMLIGSPMAYTERIPPYGWELPQDLILRAIICSIFSTVCENEGRILKLSFIMYKNMQDFEIKISTFCFRNYETNDLTRDTTRSYLARWHTGNNLH